MAVQIGAPAESGFDNPLGMLVDCHRRIEHFLHILCVVVERAEARVLTAEEANAVEAALHYFRIGGHRHTADEEESLFPRLRAVGDSGASPDLIALEHDHEAANRLHAEVEAAYRRWLGDAALTADEHLRLAAATRQLQQLYQQHIRIEEDVVFPHAARILDSETVRLMGEEFRQRRV